MTVKTALQCISLALLAILAGVGGHLVLPAVALADGESPVVVNDGGATIHFPDSITFTARAISPEIVQRVVLEYGLDELTCGTVVAKAFPQFTPATAVDVSWVWDMRKSGSEPPGARIWYQWRVTDRAGRETLSPKQSITWLENDHFWQSITEGNLTLHWYMGAQTFAQSLIDSASQSLKQLKRETGVNLDSPVDLYIYASPDDLQNAVLFEPGWTGGLAYPTYGIVLIGISPDQLSWGEEAEAHELTHVIVGHLAFTCLGTIPTWLNEGIAMYGQGGPEQESMVNLDRAIVSNNVLSIEVLSGQFSENADKADLSYAQSYSIVSYLIKTFGQEKINSLFRDISRGLTADAALRDVYGFGLDDLDAGWRKFVGAPPSQNSLAVTATVVPTAVPTYQLQGIPTAPAGGSAQTSSAPASSSGGLQLPIAALLLVPVIPLLVGVFVFLKKRKRL